MENRRVVIIGAGIIGSAIARNLSRHGIDVTVVERGATAGGTSSSGEGNLLVSDKGPGAELELAQYSLRLWRELSSELAEEVGAHFPSIEFEHKGGVVAAFGSSESEALGLFAQSQRRAGVDARPLSVDEALELEPNLSSKITSAMYYPEDAQVQPAIATEALLASARAAGARVLVGTEVLGAECDSQGRLVGVRTSEGNIVADDVVVAAGPWSGLVAGLLGGNLSVFPRKGFLLVTSRMPASVFHKVYDADYVGAVGSDDHELQTSTVIESTASGTVLIGSSRQHVGFDNALDVEALRQMAIRAVRLMPSLSGASIIRAYSGFRPFALDHLPVIGPDNQVPGLWYAAGHEGAGIGLAPATAALLASLMLGEPSTIEASSFLPNRASLAGSLAGTA
jgi:glycine/D-amino acid oxidase-like deaminating enzyme